MDFEEIETHKSMKGEPKPAGAKKKWWRTVIDITAIAVFLLTIAVSTNIIYLSLAYDLPFFVNGMSMYPTLNADGKRFVTSTNSYRPLAYDDHDNRGDIGTIPGDLVDFGYGHAGSTIEWRKKLVRNDIVITYFPKDASGWNPDGTPILKDKVYSKIKRIIGLPGETVHWQAMTSDGEDYNRIWGKTTITPVSGETFVYKPLYTLADYHVPEGKAYAFPNGDMTWTLGEDEFIVMGDNRGYSDDSRVFGVLKGSLITGKADLIAGTKRLNSERKPVDTYWHYFTPWNYWKVK